MNVIVAGKVDVSQSKTHQTVRSSIRTNLSDGDYEGV